MTKLAELLLPPLIAALCVMPLAADGNTGDEFDDGSFFQEIGEGSGDAEQPVADPAGPEIGGELRLENRWTFDYDDPGASSVASVPGVRLDIDYAGKKTDVVIALDIEQEANLEQATSLIDEAYLRYYGSGFDFEVGYLKVVWGPGDGTHAINVLNPVDYGDFINPDYLERLEAAPMLKFNVPVNDGLMELAWIPLFTPDSIPREGRWAPAEAQALNAALATAITTAAAGDALTYLTLTENAVREENTADLEHSQFAFRFTKSVGPADLGAVYYLGYYKQPTVDTSQIATSAPHVSLTYDRVQMVGVEGAGVLGGFNLRAETGWYMSEDYQGDDSEVRNSELRWVGGFDYNLPISNLNLNLQETGTLILDYENIDATGDAQSGADQSVNRVILNISDSWNNERVLPEVSFIYGVEDADWLIAPELSFLTGESLEILLSAGIYGGEEEGFFGQFDENDFLELSVRYAF